MNGKNTVVYVKVLKQYVWEHQLFNFEASQEYTHISIYWAMMSQYNYLPYENI